MPRTSGQDKQTKAVRGASSEKIPVTTYTGVNATGVKTVIVSALIEVTGQVRFGDGTDIATTITEKDVVLGLDGNSVEKAVWAGTKRRGVDRRTAHELRDRAGWDGGDCYVGNLCMRCPVCWLYGFTGTTQQATINAKSRILYGTSLSIQDTTQCLNRHSRNQVDERTQTTAGSAGIHEEEIIVGGTCFATYTSLIHVLDWEVGVFAHAFLDNLNSNRYTAASRGQGGMKLVDVNGGLNIVVDESPFGIFPFAAPKVPASETNLAKSSEFFNPAKNSPLLLQPFKTALEAQGFAVESDGNKLTATGGNVDLVVESEGQCLVVHQGPDQLMKRYYGSQAVGYLRQKQIELQKKLADSNWRGKFKNEVMEYTNALQKNAPASETPKGGDESGETPDVPIPEDGGEANG